MDMITNDTAITAAGSGVFKKEKLWVLLIPSFVENEAEEPKISLRWMGRVLVILQRALKQ